MDIEKYSYLWAEDSSWVLRPHGDTYRIINYGNEGQISSPFIEDDV
jgi:hypothetical protein